MVYPQDVIRVAAHYNFMCSDCHSPSPGQMPGLEVQKDSLAVTVRVGRGPSESLSQCHCFRGFAKSLD